MMKKTLVIAVWNDESSLPALLKVLGAAIKKDPMEILFVDSSSQDGSRKLLEEFAAKQKSARILSEEKPGYANAYNRGLVEANGEAILFLDGETRPEANWSLELESALNDNDIAVGLTESAKPERADPFGKTMAALFKGRSGRSAAAQGFALPWGAATNLIARREWFQKVGPFSEVAGSAYDMDWCWRAVIAGAVLGHAPKAKALRKRPEGREAVLHHFEAYGLGEAWIHRAYGFLLGEGAIPEDGLMASNEAYLRLRRYSPVAKIKGLQEPLEEVAMAFAGGIRLGYDRAETPCGLKRVAPKKAIGWESGKKELTVFVPGKGLTTLPAAPAVLFRAWRKGASQEELETLYRKAFRASTHVAQHGVEDLLEALSPMEIPTSWVAVKE